MPMAYPILATLIGFLSIMGAISFIVHYRIIKSRRLRLYFRDSETRTYLIILVLGIVIVSSYAYSKGQSVGPLAYEVIGASTGSYELAPTIAAAAGNFIKATLIVLMLVGGSSNSAAGGLKVGRVFLLFKYVFWKVKQEISPPGSISHFKHDGTIVSTEEVASVAVFAFIYCVAIIGVAGIMVAYDYDTADSLLIVTSMQGCSGISTSPAWEFPDIVKIALCCSMLFGRLEFIPLFALAMYALRRT